MAAQFEQLGIEAIVKGGDRYVSDLQKAKAAEDAASKSAESLGKAGEAASDGVSGFDALKDSIQGVGGFIGGLLPQLAAMTSGFAAAFALRDAIDTTIELGGEISTLQRTFGGTAEQASALHFALEETGVGFDKGLVALTRFSRALAGVQDIEEGNLPVGKALAEQLIQLGIRTQDAAGAQRPFADVLGDVSEVFKNMPNGIDKTALATQLFGRQGKDLLPFLNQGRDGLQELAAKAGEFGLVLDQSLLDKLKQSKIAQREFNEALEGVKVTIASAVLPAMTDLLGGITKLVAGFSQDLIPVIRTVVGFIRDQFTAALQRAIDFLEPIGKAIADRIVPALLSMGSAILDHVQGPLEDMLGFIAGQKEALDVFGSTLATVAVAIVGVGAALPVVSSALDVFSAAMTIALDPVTLVTVGIAALAVAAFELYQHWGELTDRFPVINDAMDAVTETAGYLADALIGIGETINDALGSSATDAFNALVQGVEDVAAAFREEAAPQFEALVSSSRDLIVILTGLAQFIGRQLVKATNDFLEVFSKLVPLFSGTIIVGIKAITVGLQAMATVLGLVAKYVDPLDLLLIALAFNLDNIAQTVKIAYYSLDLFARQVIFAVQSMISGAEVTFTFGSALGIALAAITAIDVGLRALTGSGLFERLTGFLSGGKDQAEKAADALDKFNSATERLTKEQKLDLAAEQLQKLIDTFNRFNTEFDLSRVNAINTPILQELQVKARELGEAMRENGASVEDVIATYERLPEPLQGAYAAGVNLQANIVAQTEASKELAKQQDATSAALAEGAKQSRALADSVQGSVAPIGAGTLAAQELGHSIVEIGTDSVITTDQFKILVGAISDTNPVVLELKAKSALLASELADLTAAGKNQTQEEKDHITSLTAEKDAIDNQIKAFDAHQKAIDAVGKAIGLTDDQFGQYLSKMEELKVPQADFVADTKSINDAFDKLNQGSISEAIGLFDTLKGKLSPEIWAPIGDAVGPKLVQAITDSFGPGPQRDQLLSTVYSLGLAVPPKLAEGVEKAASDINARIAAAGQSIGAQFDLGIGAGIEANASVVNQAAGKVTTDAIDYAAAQAGISSPSKVAAEKVGAPIAEGVAMGITDETLAVLTAGRDLIGQLIDGMRQEGETKGKDALDGLIEGLDLDGATDRLKKQFGDTGSQLMQAFAKALEDGSYASGKALATTLAQVLDTLPTDLVPGIEELGSQLMDAFVTAMQTQTPEAIAAVESIFGQIQSEIQAASTLTVDTFRSAFSDIFADAQLKDQLGSDGASLMAALTKAIQEGGVQNINALAQMAVNMREQLFDKFPPEQAEYWATLLISAINNAITAKTPEATAALQGVLSQLHNVLEGGAFDVTTQTTVMADDVKALADAFGVGISDVVDNIGLFVQTGLVDNVERLKDLPDLVVRHVQNILKGLADGRITLADAIDAISHLFSTIPLKAADSLKSGAPLIQNAAQVLASAVADGITKGMNISGPTAIDTLKNLLTSFNTELQTNLDTGKNTAEDRIKAIWDVLVHTTEIAGFPEAVRNQIQSAIAAMVVELASGKGVATSELQSVIDALINVLETSAPDLAAAAAAAGSAAVPKVPAGDNGASNSGIGGTNPGTGPALPTANDPSNPLPPGTEAKDPMGVTLYWNGHYWQQEPYTPGTPTQPDSTGAYYTGDGVLVSPSNGTGAFPTQTRGTTEPITDTTIRKRRRSRWPRFAEGIDIIPFDTFAFLHAGEAVIPASENPYAGKMPPWFSTLVRSMPRGNGSGPVTVDLSGSTFTGTPAENAAGIEDAVRTALATVLDRDSFLYGTP